MSDDVKIRRHPDVPTVTQLQPEPKRLWLEALRSGRFEQTQNYLSVVEDGETKHCCLGVLCEVAIEAGVDVSRSARDVFPSGEVGGYAYNGNTTMPPNVVIEWAYGTQLGVLTVVVEREVDDEPILTDRELVTLNDEDKLSFEEIAQIIEDTL